MNSREQLIKDIWQKISELYYGQPINEQTKAQIEGTIKQELIRHVAEGTLDAEKWHQDNEIAVVQSPINHTDLIIHIPKWLEEWLENVPDSEIEQIIEKPEGGETDEEYRQRMLVNRELARIPRDEEI